MSQQSRSTFSRSMGAEAFDALAMRGKHLERWASAAIPKLRADATEAEIGALLFANGSSDASVPLGRSLRRVFSIASFRRRRQHASGTEASFGRHAKKSKRSRLNRKRRGKRSREALEDVRGSPVVFGDGVVSLDAHAAQGNMIPPFVVSCLDRLQREGPLTRGLFRVNGSKEDASCVKAEVNSGQRHDASGLEVHLVADLLKAFVRELDQPLLGMAFHTLAELADAPLVQRIEGLTRVVSAMPVANQVLLHRLLALLQTVAAAEDATLMSALNLAKVFAPNLVRPEAGTDSLAMLQMQTKVNEAVHTLVVYMDAVFADVNLPSLVTSTALPSASACDPSMANHEVNAVTSACTSNTTTATTTTISSSTLITSSSITSSSSSTSATSSAIGLVPRPSPLTRKRHARGLTVRKRHKASVPSSAPARAAVARMPLSPVTRRRAAEELKPGNQAFVATPRSRGTMRRRMMSYHTSVSHVKRMACQSDALYYSGEGGLAAAHMEEQGNPNAMLGNGGTFSAVAFKARPKARPSIRNLMSAFDEAQSENTTMPALRERSIVM